jgi:hypothetical protein
VHDYDVVILYIDFILLKTEYLRATVLKCISIHAHAYVPAYIRSLQSVRVKSVRSMLYFEYIFYALLRK